MENILVTNIGKARCAAGAGAAELLGRELERLGVRRPLLVSDAGVAALPKYEKTLSQLKAAGLEPVVYDKVTPNPKDYEVMEGTELYKARGCDGVVGIGGGSSMDCAKGISAMARHEGKIMDYGRSTPNRRFFIRGREPLFCVPLSPIRSGTTGKAMCRIRSSTMICFSWIRSLPAPRAMRPCGTRASMP